MPWHSLALSVILLTLLVRAALIPLANRATHAQIAMKKIQPKLDQIKKDTPDQTEQGKKIMEVYKEEGIHPLSGCIFILIQFPIIIALYYVFARDLASVAGSLYPFIHMPEHISTTLFGIDLTHSKAIILAVLAGLSQLVQLKLSPNFTTSKTSPVVSVEPKGFQQTFAESFQKQTVFMLPLMIAFFGYFMPGAVALYWIVNNIVSVVQERLAMKSYEKKYGKLQS